MRLDHIILLSGLRPDDQSFAPGQQKHARRNRCVSGLEKLPFAEYSVASSKLGELETWRVGELKSPNHQFTNSLTHQWLFERLSGTTDDARYARLESRDPHRRTPGSKFAGGHRIRVPPVPIPNTEVKPDTADGTAWETVWESRSLPALFGKADVRNRVGPFYWVIEQSGDWVIWLIA